MQTASSALHSIGTGEGDVLPFRCPLDFVSFSFHEDDEILTAATFLHGIADIVHQPELPALPFLRRPPFPGGHFLAAAFVLGQDRKAVSHADIITDQPQELECIWILTKLQSSLEVYGVDDEVTMDMVGVAVGGDEDFRAGPGAGCELHGDLMGLPGSDVLQRRKGLHILIEVDAVHLAVGCLGRFELQNGIHPIAVDAADEPLAGSFIPGLVLSHAVIHHGSHSTEVLPGFPDIGHGSYAASPPRLMR